MATEVITAIVPSKRGAQRLVVKVGGRTVATLPARAVAELGLSVGGGWDGAVDARVGVAVACDKAVNVAAGLIARRVLSVAELRSKLGQRGFDEGVMDAAVARLRELGLLDDERLGRALIEETLARKAVGPLLLGAKLQRRGLDDGLVEKLVNEVATTPPDSPPPPDGETAVGSPRAMAESLARERWSKMASLDPATRKRRLWGLLTRRGFEPDTVAQVMEKLEGQM
jgi:regulatory protein